MKTKKEAIKALATEIYAKAPGKLYVTEQNAKGNLMLIDQAIDLAVLFFDRLDKRLVDAEAEPYERP